VEKRREEVNTVNLFKKAPKGGGLDIESVMGRRTSDWAGSPVGKELSGGETSGEGNASYEKRAGW